jgi:hypothetical protein
MHLLRPLRHTLVVARTSAIRSARISVAFSRPNFIRGLLTQSRDRGSSDVSVIQTHVLHSEKTKKRSKRMTFDHKYSGLADHNPPSLH